MPRGQYHLGGFLVDQLGHATHTAARLGRAGPMAGVRPRSASSSRLDRAAGDGWLATGDAASAWDPLSSQGVYRALVGGLGAARALAGYLEGDGGVLGVYADSVEVEHGEYLMTRSSYYGLECRWPRSPFWRRRHAP